MPTGVSVYMLLCRECVCGVGEREAGTLKFYRYIRRLGRFLGVKILNFDILGVFRKITIIWQV